MYEASNIRSGGRIEKVNIERANEKSVWAVGGRRRARVSDWTAYFDTFDEAKAHIVLVTTGAYHRAKENAEYTKEKMLKALALTEQETGV